jgi:DNA invertase Pin-like site-specific DNA recombinase
MAQEASMSRSTLLILTVAEDEARRISDRTRDALQAAKARGVKLGNPENLTDAARRKGAKAAARKRTATHHQRAADPTPLVEEIRAAGVASLRGIARELEARRVPTVRGGRGTAVQVSGLLGVYP